MKKTFKTIALISALALSMTACTTAPAIAEPEEDIVVTTVETTLPEVTTTAVTTTETTTTPEITTTEATTTPVITTTVPETTTTVPETTTVVTTTTAPVTTTTVVTTPARPVGYEIQMTQELIDATNAERRRLGIHELKIDQTLMDCAAIRSKESAQNNYLAHKRPNGADWDTVLPNNYFWMTCGENAALTHEATSGVTVYNQFANSPGHYKGMTSPEFSRFGVSIYRDSRGRVHSYMIFTD